jgi:hypothetical protein
VSPTAALRRRRAIAHYADSRRTRTRLADTAAELTSRAQPYLDAGRPDLAQPYLDEAEVLAEAAGAPLPRL